MGNQHNSLTQMAVDVLSELCMYSLQHAQALSNFTHHSASSVDVKHPFSCVPPVVSKCRHNLNTCTIEATATLGQYSNTSRVKPRISQLPSRTTGKGKDAANVEGKLVEFFLPTDL